MSGTTDSPWSDAARRDFEQVFAAQPGVVAFAPGRVNLIGEHTDYNEGLVLPMPIRQGVWVAARECNDQRRRVYSANLREQRQLDNTAGARSSWARYVLGVITLLERRGARISGLDLLISGDLPQGAGLASSAALCVACSLALANLCGEPFETLELAQLCQAVEHEFAGVPCGIMDPLVSLAGTDNAALLIDCRLLEWRSCPLPFDKQGAGLYLISSGVRHELSESAYATRVSECRQAAAHFAKLQSGVRSLRDVTPEMLRAQAQELKPEFAARAAHVIHENDRVRAAAAALESGDLVALGRLLRASHASLRDQFEISVPQADQLVQVLCDLPGVLGARLTGGGFGGTVLVLASRTVEQNMARLVERVFGASGAGSATGPQLVQSAGGARFWTFSDT